MKAFNPKLVLAADNRLNFLAEILGSGGPVSALKQQEASKLMDLLASAAIATCGDDSPNTELAFWTDLPIGETALLQAKSSGVMVGISGNTPQGAPLNHEAVLATAQHFAADFVGIRVDFNPEFGQLKRQLIEHGLTTLVNSCRDADVPTLLELYGEPTLEQVRACGTESAAQLMIVTKSLEELTRVGVEPTVWALGMLQHQEALEASIGMFHLDGMFRHLLLSVGRDPFTAGYRNAVLQQELIHLSQMTDDKKTVSNLPPGTHGLIVGPAAYFDHLVNAYANSITYQEAVEGVKHRLLMAMNAVASR